jgi:transposase
LMGPTLSNNNTNVRPCSMAKDLVPNELWMFIDPLLPPEPPKPNGGRPRDPDRAALAGIIYVLKSGIPWGMLPKELGFESGVTCLRWLRDWQKARVWHRLHRVLLDELGKAGLIDRSRARLAWLSRCRRLCVRYERRADIHLAFLLFCCSLICLSYLRHAF